MVTLQPFHDAFRSPRVLRTLDDADRRRLDGRVPPEVLELWTAHGLCSYEEGLFNFLDPDDVLPSLQAWREVLGTAVPMAANAFCDLLCWDGKVHYVLLGHFAELGVAGFTTTFQFNEGMTDKAFRKEFLEEPLFKKAKKKCGVLGPLETYTFEPALSLGGQPTIEHVVKVRLPEQLALLSQLQPLRRM